MIGHPVTIGFITYGKSTSKYLPYFLESLSKSVYKDFEIIAVDNSEKEDNDNIGFLNKSSLRVEVDQPGQNIGFARAFNLMIGKAIRSGSRYFLALNPDMVIEPDMIGLLLRTIESDERIAAVQPKIYRWDFKNGEKTEIIDSLGLKIDDQHRFGDIKHGEIDDGALDVTHEIFGFTGAAVLLRLDALKDVAYKEEYFDELMFMYKEDCDLSYRLRLAGWKIFLEPAALAHHDRTTNYLGESSWQILLNRYRKSRSVKRWSFLNQLILLYKFKTLGFSGRVQEKTSSYRRKMEIYALIFEPYQAIELMKFWRLKKEIKKRRATLKIRIGIPDIEKWMA